MIPNPGTLFQTVMPFCFSASHLPVCHSLHLGGGPPMPEIQCCNAYPARFLTADAAADAADAPYFSTRTVIQGDFATR
jgi:hypothetical protein